MIEFSVTFICVSERCFICMIMCHERERASRKVCVRVCVCMCIGVYLHMCTCMNVSLYRMKCQLPCPRVNETPVLRIQLIFVEAWHVTSRTWAMKNVKNVEIGVTSFCQAGATTFSIFSFKTWWRYVLSMQKCLECEWHTQVLHVVLIALFLQEGYSKWHVAMYMVLPSHLNFIQ